MASCSMAGQEHKDLLQYGAKLLLNSGSVSAPPICLSAGILSSDDDKMILLLEERKWLGVGDVHQQSRGSLSTSAALQEETDCASFHCTSGRFISWQMLPL